VQGRCLVDKLDTPPFCFTYASWSPTVLSRTVLFCANAMVERVMPTFPRRLLSPNDSNSDRHLKAQHRNESKRSTLLHIQTPNTDVYLKRRHRDVQVFKHLRDALTLAQYFPLVFQLLQNRFKSNKLQSRPLCAFSNSISPSQA
jgi:hypothetical protein